MTARILVVDDNPANRKLLEARLIAEYFEVITAAGGVEALELCEEGRCDIVLLDVMMPVMDGFEVCRRLKAGTRTAHLPVVMVTALDQPADRVRGLSAGADDFVTKPIDEVHLLARVRSLSRLKMVVDELRHRAASAVAMGIQETFDPEKMQGATPGKLLLVDDRASSAARMQQALTPQFEVVVESNAHEAMFKAAEDEFDVVVVSLGLKDFDALRLASQIRAMERTRHLPILMIADLEDRPRVLRGLELGINDWLSRPVDRNELIARVRTQLRLKRYAEYLRKQVEQSIELALVDPLTGLNNRRFLENQLPPLVEAAKRDRKPLALMVFDIDHFKTVNDTWGHDAGDDVLRAFADRLRAIIRGGDLLCRIGGEEFVILMPNVNGPLATKIAERARKAIEEAPFAIHNGAETIAVTTSIGVAERREGVDATEIYVRADRALYQAKVGGRNRVAVAA